MRYFLLAATALVMISAPAYAQVSTSGSASNAVNTSGSQSSAISNPRATVSGNSVGNGASASTSGARSVASTRSGSTASASPTLTSTTRTNVYIADLGSGSSGTSSGSSSNTATLNNNYSGSYTLRNTPDVTAPSVMGGNPCAVGASGGVSMPGFGLTAGTTWADRSCERRQQAALLFNMGEPAVARELLCQDDQVRKAMRASGRPCAADTEVAQASAPQSAVAAAVVHMASAAQEVTTAAPTQGVKTIALAALPARAKPDWCTRAAPSTEASKAYFAEVCS